MFLKPVIRAILLFCGITLDVGAASAKTGEAAMKDINSFRIQSPAFDHDSIIPSLYTCDGPNISPPVSWTGAPPETKSLALIVDDPDAPRGDWVHWVVFNIPPETSGLEQDHRNLPPGAIQGSNDFGRREYGGPCPPGGEHRYFFKLYALDGPVNLKPGASKTDLLAAMEGHILRKTELIGRYQRSRG